MVVSRKLICECGGVYKEKKVDFEGFEVPAMVCFGCDNETFTIAQSKKVFQLMNTHKLFERRRKIIKVGSSIAITLPKVLQQHGWKPGTPVQWTRVSNKKWNLELVD